MEAVVSHHCTQHIQFPRALQPKVRGGQCANYVQIGDKKRNPDQTERPAAKLDFFSLHFDCSTFEAPFRRRLGPKFKISSPPLSDLFRAQIRGVSFASPSTFQLHQPFSFYPLFSFLSSTKCKFPRIISLRGTVLPLIFNLEAKQLMVSFFSTIEISVEPVKLALFGRTCHKSKYLDSSLSPDLQ